MKLKKEPKSYSCKSCGKPFYKKITTDKYCSYSCASKGKHTIKSISSSNKYYSKVRQLLIDKYLDEQGYYTCENCGISSSVPMDIHHIFYRSEVPNHKYLNDPRNLIMCCRGCHEYFHYSKDNRKDIAEKRGLYELFSDRHNRYNGSN